MSAIEVTTQKQLDKALKELKDGDWVVCLGGTWDDPLVVRESSRVVAWGSSSVVAWGSSRVVAWGSSRVVAWGSSSVVARESSSVVARESSSVEAWGSSRVVAWESSSVVARESSSVVARESSSVEAWGSSRVVAWGSSRVEARGSSRVEARESSSVEARESSSVEAGDYVAVHKHPGHRTQIKGGVVIEVPDVSKLDAKGWCGYFGVEVTRGYAVLFKCVDDDYATDYSRSAGIFYTPGSKVSAPDWRKTKACGQGLHASPSPAMAREYHSGTRYVAVRVKLADLVVLDNKVKAPALTVLHECDVHGDVVAEKGNARDEAARV